MDFIDGGIDRGLAARGWCAYCAVQIAICEKLGLRNGRG
jgi:hypothetical protein